MNEMLNGVPEPGTARTGMLEEAQRLAVDAMYTERGHYQAACQWRKCHYWLNGPAAILAAIAGGTFIAKVSSWVPPLLAFVAALFSALSTFLKPDVLASEHQAAGVRFATIRKKLRMFIAARLHLGGVTDEMLLSELDKLRQEYAETQASSRPIPAYAYALAKQGIQAGEASYKQDEISAAVGSIQP
ncbi:SLATT domain-containing protein [Acetobacter orleanensis]|uniref:SMODS and SLOG-associating 2TM effector domain-containing protein n=1 Tax=Acetobacter orleanensis TaxID=104099 RepID=A0A4Y3TPK9_9PROT|nr:SLATT domain-containing protein [Acetobacter orleanensis]KXV66015.1 hypothetical protein AD949_03510 [Acetobacter orleanensis]PCD78499.1 hypothetical protein CO710_11820 [Acetobacter orleanensis]GAN69833.1 hypothetical protein Abol_083_005 [Acetobacter orleanensis JCM 7639]GBR28824.1 hypothetical protein AA0473_1861 [Acetobacter orleanensis NRIC 0473]GEB83718.1 hypothetical protein AOR01nite_21950 [Acetobacter orleanensis]